MTDRSWFDGIDLTDADAAADRITHGEAQSPRHWPAEAIEAEVVSDVSEYHDLLRECTLLAFEAELDALSGAADRTLIQLVRTYDATMQAEHELRQRVAEAITEGSATEVSETEIPVLREALADEATPLSTELDRLLETLGSLQTDLDAMEATLAKQSMSVAPNLAHLAGPMLAARLIAVAGSLEELAKLPSSTMQVLGAEGALFAHLCGEASSPKHGLIFTHPAVRSAPADDRGPIARTLAGKLTIAARIDHYRGELEPTLEDELDQRLATIREGAT